MKYSFVFLLVGIFFVSCSNISKSDSGNSEYISEKQAKEIVAKEVSESDYYQQFYVLSSEKFDERVSDISWGESVLVSVIPDGKFFKEAEKYYLLTGVLSDGQVLVAQTVNAKTGELMDGVLLNDENSDILSLASKTQATDYAARMGYSAENIEAVYYFDGTSYTIDPIFSWRYCINTKNNRSVCENIEEINDYIFVDPWIQSNEKNEKNLLTASNAFFSKFNINHRAYCMKKIENSKSARNLSEENSDLLQFCPID